MGRLAGIRWALVLLLTVGWGCGLPSFDPGDDADAGPPPDSADEAPLPDGGPDGPDGDRAGPDLADTPLDGPDQDRADGPGSDDGAGDLGDLGPPDVPLLPRTIGLRSSDWTFACDNESAATCTGNPSDEITSSSVPVVHFVTNALFDFTALVPASRDLGLDPAIVGSLRLVMRATNPHVPDWQPLAPLIILGGAGDSLCFQPSQSLLPNDGQIQVTLQIPLAGDATWTRHESSGVVREQGCQPLVGGSSQPLTRLDWIEIHADSWGAEGFELFFEGGLILQP